MFEILDKTDQVAHSLIAALMMAVSVKTFKVNKSSAKNEENLVPGDNFPHVFLN